MKYKKSLPPDVRELCTAHVRGYERRRRAWKRGEAGVTMGPQDRKSVEAVETALFLACHGIKSAGVREHLQEGLLLNLENRKAFPYERLFLPGMGKKEFYRRKQEFLVALAEELGYLNG